MCVAAAIDPIHIINGLWVVGDVERVNSSTEALAALMACLVWRSLKNSEKLTV